MMLTIAGVFFYLMVWGWLAFSAERERRKYHERQHAYWLRQAKSAEGALLRKQARVDGDEWKNACGY